MKQAEKNLHCNSCSENSVNLLKFPYPDKIRIDKKKNKAVLSYNKWLVIPLVVFLIISLINIFFQGNMLMYIPAVLILFYFFYLLLYYKNTAAAYIYRCDRCGIVWLSEDGAKWEDAVPDNPEILKILGLTEVKAEKNPGQSWKCSSCGETVPGTFDVCWNCQAKKGV